MGRDLGVPAAAVGWFVAIAQLGYLAGLVLLVPLGDLLDRRRLIALHLLLLAGGLTAAAAAPSGWVALCGLAVAGVFAVVVQTTVAYTASLSGPSERGRNLGIVTSGVVIGILGSRLLAGLLADVWGWRGIYFVLAVLAAGLGPVSLRLLPAEGRSAAPRYGNVLRAFIGRFAEPVFLGRGLIAFFLFASFGTLWSGMALPLSGAPWHLSEAQIGLFGIAGLAGAAGAARTGRWADAGHANRVTGIALAVLLASWAAIGQLPRSLPLLVLGVIVLDFAVQAVHVSNQHILTTVHADRVSTTIGAYMVFYSLGSATGAAATTAVYGTAGWTGSALLGAAFALAGLLTPAAHARPGDRPPGAHRRGGSRAGVPGPSRRRRRRGRPGHDPHRAPRNGLTSCASSAWATASPRDSSASTTWPCSGNGSMPSASRTASTATWRTTSCSAWTPPSRTAPTW
ncbi:MFS transporter [Dactylosporangium sp. NPDC000244]|uniref:MFS transporter n=1 Tax=Dactylosporangium sp. NPDC000244 TaxID=3154365 RepID=UPI0033239152